MSAKYSCIVRLKGDLNPWNINGNLESCIDQLTALGLEWEFIALENPKTQLPIGIFFPYDDSLLG